jgi:uncharacterized protein
MILLATVLGFEYDGVNPTTRRRWFLLTLSELITLVDPPEQLFNEAQTRGFVTALAASPYLISPQEWLADLWGDNDVAPFAEAAQLEAYCDCVIQLWNQSREALFDETWQWPDGYQLESQTIVSQDVKDFCEGLLQGWQLTKDDWESLLPLDSESGALLGGFLLAVTMLYDPDTSLAALQEIGAEDLEQFDEIYYAIPVMLSGLTRLGTELAEQQDDE